MSKVVVIGLDGAAPWLLFERWREKLPHIGALIDRGAWGRLRTIDPPITVPAWAVMFSGRDPGELGIYGFRNRRAHDYDGYAFASSGLLPGDMVWDLLGRAGKQVILLGIPPSYPPRPVHGSLVSCFLTPSTSRPYTHPASLRDEVEAAAGGGYVVDVEDFRTDDKEALLGRIREKTRKHFAVARHLLRTRPWDLFAMVEMGIDRVQHGFWRHIDPEHPGYAAGNPFEDRILDYYRAVDAEIGELLALIPADAAVFLVSDHGARALDGSFMFNDWLIRHGYLVLHDRLATPVPLTADRIDWSRTRAWGEGGYYGRLFLNVRGREPRGIVDPGDVERLLRELTAAIAEIEDPAGGLLGAEARRPQDLYREVRGVPPELMVYFGDLRWRAAGSVGHPLLQSADNDSGPDDCNHDWNGVFVLRDGENDLGGRHLEGLRLIDMARTLLARAGVEAPDNVRGRRILVPRQSEGTALPRAS